MKERTKRINRAIREAKQRDGKCLACFAEEGLEGAHLLPRNVGYKAYDPGAAKFIITLCSLCHRSFDALHSVDAKIAWLIARGLYKAADLIAEVTGFEVPARLRA